MDLEMEMVEDVTEMIPETELDGGISDEEAAYWEEQRRQELENKVAPCRQLGEMIRALMAGK